MWNFLEDGQGNKSSTRLMMAIWGVGIFITWAIVCIKTASIADIPAGVQVVLGTVLTAKVAQSFAEKNNG